MDFQQLDFLRWVHILALAYWLGGEWGVFQTSYHVTNSSLSLEERKTAHVNHLSHRYPRAHGYRLYRFLPILDGAGITLMSVFSRLGWA